MMCRETTVRQCRAGVKIKTRKRVDLRTKAKATCLLIMLIRKPYQSYAVNFPRAVNHESVDQ